jgi:hypothetical protein
VETNTFLVPDTEHGLLIAFGEFARQHGLINGLMGVPIQQKTVTFQPQTKLVEFLVGILSGIEYLEDLNAGPHPLVKDQAVIRAWDQSAFAHYSSVSRTLEACDTATVQAVQKVIDLFSQPFIAQAIQEQLRRGEPLVFDLDLMGQAVSSTSETYPDAEFGWMNDSIQLGYQLARVCIHTRRWGRVWLAGFHHPGSIVSAACLQELILAAETQARVRPRRRTELVRQRLEALDLPIQRYERLIRQQSDHLHTQQTALDTLKGKCYHAEQVLKGTMTEATRERLTHQRDGWQGRLPKVEKAIARSQRVLAGHRQRLQAWHAERTATQAWLEKLEADNATNPDAPICEARMDAAFTTGVNLTWLIEMGYIPNTKAPSDKTTRALRKEVTPQTTWVRVGDNAEMTGRSDYFLHECPYPLTVALERFKVGPDYKYATLVTYRDTAWMPTLPEWFRHYNGRQTIEAGNKEMKGPFHVQHLMSRSPAGIQIQVLFTGLGSNLIRWCAPWLRACAAEATPSLDKTLSSPKRMIRVAANASAVVQHTRFGLSLRFTSQSALPDVTLFLRGVPAFQPSLGFFQPFENASS